MKKEELTLQLGDKAIVIIDKNVTHCYKKGEEVTVIDLIADGNPPYYECDNGKEKGKWFMSEEQLKKL